VRISSEENCREEDFLVHRYRRRGRDERCHRRRRSRVANLRKAGLPVSAVQLQVLGAENVQEATPVATSITPVQLSVLTRRKKITTAQGRTETVGYAIR